MDVASDVIFKAVILGFAGLALWIIKGFINQKGEVQRAPCGFMTLEDIEAYCHKRSDLYVKTISEKMDTLIFTVNEKLDVGDRRLTSHSERLRGLEKELIESTAVLRLITSDTLKEAVKEAVKEV